jgi:RimJ/RimL family protein N-acetyltransferase
VPRGGRLPARIRPATRADAEAIAALTADAWRAAYAGFVPAPMIERWTKQDELVARWHAVLAGDASILVATIESQVRGYVGSGPSRDTEEPPQTGEIYAIYVTPPHWRQGLGRRLMDAALERLSDAGFGEAMLWTFADNSPARRFYEAMGFEHDGGLRRPQRSGGVPEVRYRRSLDTDL